MPTWIALLRGINVGGKNRLPMTQLVGILEDLGCSQAKTYIQSGNVVFRSRKRDASKLAASIGREIESRHGFKPDVMILTAEALEKAIAANPFPQADDAPKALHVFFLAGQADHLDLVGLEELRSETEEFKMIDNVFYLYAPEDFGRSKLARGAERLIGVPVTARNWRSIHKIAELARELD